MAIKKWHDWMGRLIHWELLSIKEMAEWNWSNYWYRDLSRPEQSKMKLKSWKKKTTKKHVDFSKEMKTTRNMKVKLVPWRLLHTLEKKKINRRTGKFGNSPKVIKPPRRQYYTNQLEYSCRTGEACCHVIAIKNNQILLV